MAVRFILGRAGSGKTRYCITSLRERLIAEPISGPKLILLVPEQAALQTERALFTGESLDGSTRGEVLSFRRLSQRILQSVPRPPAQTLSQVGRSMVLQKLLTDLTPKLSYYKCSRLLPGLCRKLAAQIEEFVASGASPADLILENQPPNSENLQAKLKDLRLIYAGYLDHLDRGFVDPIMHLDVARELLPQVGWLEGASVWLDGFAGLTQQQLLFLVDMALRVERVEVALLLDPDAKGVCDDEAPDPFSLFAPTEKTYHSLRAGFRGAGLEIEPPHIFPSGKNNHDTVSDELEHVRTHLFESSHAWPNAPRRIQVYQAADPRDEMNRVMQRVRELTSRAQEPLRYRDIAIITRNLDDEHELIATSLRSCGIPYFIDRRAAITEHPLHHLLRALLKLKLDDLSVDAVRSLLKSELVGVEPTDADRLENYILAHRISGLRAWSRADWTRDPLFRSPFDTPEESPSAADLLDGINNTRREIVDRLAGWLTPDMETDHSSTAPSGRLWAKCLFDTLERLSVPKQIEAWATEADSDGEADQALHHRQAWASIVQLFDDFVLALGETSTAFSDFAACFEAGLAQLDMGLVPPAVDQIVVGSVERSRQPEIRATFVLGMNDGTFPLAAEENQLLNDTDRTMLISAGLKIDPPRSARLGDERFLAYIAMTRATEYLHISYSATDIEGRKLEPSPYLNELRRILPTLQIEKAQSGEPGEKLRHILTANDLSEELCLHLGAGAVTDRSHNENRQLFNALYERCRNSETMRSPIARTLRSLAYANTARLDREIVEAMNETTLRTSITQLETFAQCPFRLFASRSLRLSPRATGEVDAIQLGSLYHAVLDRFTRSLLDGEESISDLSDSQIEARLLESAGDFNRALESVLPEESSATSFVMERLHQELKTALICHGRFQQAGTCKTRASELAFGLPGDDSAPAIELDTPKGRAIRLRGKIDRLDIADTPAGRLGFVYDYKRSRKRLLKISDVYHGLSLQLLVYLLGMESFGRRLTGERVIPGGAFYLPLVPDFESVDHPDAEAADPTKSYRPRGIFNLDALAALDRELEIGASSVLAVRINADGALSQAAGNDAATGDEFRRLLEYTKYKVGELCDRILDGEVDVAPYRLGKEMPCSHCDYRSLCRFEFPSSSVRRLEPLDKKQVLERLQDNA